MTNVRWRISALCFLSIAISYIDRVNLSYVAPEFMRQFHIGAGEMGIVLSAFLWTYFLLQVPMGLALDRWGVRFFYGSMAMLWGVATVMTATASSVAALLGWRILLGIGEAPATPAGTKAMGYWATDDERGLFSGLLVGGVPFGTFIGSPFIGWVLTEFGWQAVFVATGAVAIVWALVWMAYYRQPEAHKGANAAERQHIAQHNSRAPGLVPERVSWALLLRNRNVLGLSLGHACLLFNLYFFLTWLPTYLEQQHHLTTLRTGLVGAIPWFFGLMGTLLSGRASDLLVRRGWGPLAARKVFMGCGMILGMAALLSVFTTSLPLTVACLSVAVFGVLLTNGVVWAANADIAPLTQGAAVCGLQNGIGNAGGLLAPIVAGFLVQATGGWMLPLLVAALVALLGAGFYMVLLSDNARFGAQMHAVDIPADAATPRRA